MHTTDFDKALKAYEVVHPQSPFFETWVPREKFLKADIDDAGNFSLQVIIRSIFYNQKTQRLTFAVGGAITYLSDPEEEYEECLLKANALLKALNATIAEP